MFPDIPHFRLLRKRNFLIVLILGSIILITYTLIKFIPSHIQNSHFNLPSTPKTKRDLETSKNLSISAKSSDNLDVFSAIQLTDLHLSVFNDPKRLKKFQEITDLFKGIKGQNGASEFINKNQIQSQSQIPIKKYQTNQNQPLNLLLITGDLTDGRNNNYFQGQQIELEWILYHNAVAKILKNSDLPVLDLRGNHDVYGSYNSTFYRKYGFSQEWEVSRFCSDENGNSCYDFVPLDLVTLPGPTRPLNFMGYLSPKMKEHLTNYEDRPNLSIFYGHYPLSTTHDIKQKVQICKKADLYLSGHLHELTNASPTKNLAFPHISQFYAKHNFGGFELPEYELGDFRDYRRMRIMTIDNGLFNFRDFDYKDSEDSKLIVMITNPKNSWQSISGRAEEEFNKQLNLEEGHVFVYGLNLTNHCLKTLKLTETNVKNGELEFNLEQSTNNDQKTFFRNFYTFEKIMQENYTIIAECEIENVNKTVIRSDSDTVNIYHNLQDYEKHDLNHYVGFFSKLILLGNFPTGSVVFFYGLNLLCLSYLFLTYDRFYKNSQRRLKIWYALLFFQFWLVLGPWFFGKMIDQRMIYDQVKNINKVDEKSEVIFGIVFSFGSFNFYRNLKTNGLEFYYQQDHSIYMMGCECLVTFYIPILFLNALFIWYAEHLDVIYEKRGIFIKKSQGSNRLETSILPDQEGLPDTDNNSDDDILEDTIPSSSSRRLDSRDDETPIIDPVENINDNESQTQLIPEQNSSTNNSHTNSYKDHTSLHLKYILFLIPFAAFQFFHCSQFYMMILSFGGWLWFINPIGHFMTILPLSMIFSNTQRHFYYFYKSKSLPSLESER